jgi:hypothetical protein
VVPMLGSTKGSGEAECWIQASQRVSARLSQRPLIVAPHEPGFDLTAQDEQARVLPCGERKWSGYLWPAAELKGDVVVACATPIT